LALGLLLIADSYTEVRVICTANVFITAKGRWTVLSARWISFTSSWL